MSNTPQGVTVLSAAFTRPANTTAYTANDLVAVSTSVKAYNSPAIPNAVRALGDGFRLDRVRVRKSGNVTTNASFRLHLFDRVPTWTVGDNGAGGVITALEVADMLGHCGYIDVTMDAASAATGAYGNANPTTGAITVRPQEQDGLPIYVALQATGAYTPASGEVFYIDLEGIRP